MVLLLVVAVTHISCFFADRTIYNKISRSASPCTTALATCINSRSLACGTRPDQGQGTVHLGPVQKLY